MVLTKPIRETLGMMFLCFSLSLLFPFSEGGGKPSAYQVLQSYNLPVGLLPNGASGYTLDPRSGRFSVNLSSTCEFHVRGYKIQYRPPITGVISQNNLGEIDGVKVSRPTQVQGWWSGRQRIPSQKFLLES
ncbi:uncharacterized protein At5g01610-like [Bidens hawaiensis]|uniref:uncharacterized protein At5g01610-like n=1 Tax=Bidens hawaiensis TaxID=980011 RepID=UPI0040496A35